MENPLPLKLIEEQELFEKLLELLVLSTHSPKGRFSKDNSYIIFKKKMETTKDGNTVNWYCLSLIFCGYLPTNLRSSKEKQIKSIKTERIISNIDIL